MSLGKKLKDAQRVINAKRALEKMDKGSIEYLWLGLACLEGHGNPKKCKEKYGEITREELEDLLVAQGSHLIGKK